MYAVLIVFGAEQMSQRIKKYNDAKKAIVGNFDKGMMK
jgi:hypothetical protein